MTEGFKSEVKNLRKKKIVIVHNSNNIPKLDYKKKQVKNNTFPYN